MTLLHRIVLSATAVLFLHSAAIAGPVRDFENDMYAAYGDYRSALFLTNANKPEEAAKAIGAFSRKWDTLAAANAAAPPHYADDPAYGETLAKVGDIADVAAEQVAAGDLAEAHETLEAIRDEIGALHERNGIIAFSDRMNAYHAAMETVLAKDYGAFDPAQLGVLREDAAVLAYLAADVAAHPPANAAESQEFAAALQAFQSSVQALQDAARADDASAASKAVNGLKGPYAKLFLKFG